MRINEKTLPLIAERVHTGRVVVFDTETTGGASFDEICQIAAAEYVDDALACAGVLFKLLENQP